MSPELSRGTYNYRITMSGICLSQSGHTSWYSYYTLVITLLYVKAVVQATCVPQTFFM